MATYPHGLFTWTDIALPDQESGKRFYEQLFGWSSVDEPAGEQGTYTMFSQGDASIAGLSQEGEEQRSQREQYGAPPMWLSYITVGDVDDVAGRVSTLGGTLVAEPFDVMDAGRMALAQDPEGAVFALWQEGSHPGAGLFNEPVSMTWNELNTRDVEQAKSFYEQLLGWKITEEDFGGNPYHVINVGDRQNGGFMQMDENWPAQVPAHWMVYFAVDDVDAVAARVTELGGSVSVPPTDIAVGRFAIVGDSQGGTFTIFQAGQPPS